MHQSRDFVEILTIACDDIQLEACYENKNISEYGSSKSRDSNEWTKTITTAEHINTIHFWRHALNISRVCFRTLLFFPDPTRLFAMQSRCWYYVYWSEQNIPFNFTHENPALMWRKCRENERRTLTTNERLIDDRWNFWTNQINHFFFLFCRGHLVLLFPMEVQWTTTWDLLDLGAHLDHWRLNRPPDWVIVKVSWALLLTSLKFNASDSEEKKSSSTRVFKCEEFT